MVWRWDYSEYYYSLVCGGGERGWVCGWGVGISAVEGEGGWFPAPQLVGFGAPSLAGVRHLRVNLALLLNTDG